MTQAPILIVPGRGNSAAGHWQSFVEGGFAGTQRVNQANWESPVLEDWARTIDRVVRTLDQRPLLVAHSFGCLATAHAQLTLGTPVGATLFVAPADPRRFGLARSDFANPLDRPGFMIVSENDPWLSLDEATALASDWQIDHLSVGAAGHINVDSGYGRWHLGEAIIASMRRRLAPTASPAASVWRSTATRPVIDCRKQPTRDTPIRTASRN